MADALFPRMGGNPRWESANLLFGKTFAINCMKMKEIGPRWAARIPITPTPDPPLKCNDQLILENMIFCDGEWHSQVNF